MKSCLVKNKKSCVRGPRGRESKNQRGAVRHCMGNGKSVLAPPRSSTSHQYGSTYLSTRSREVERGKTEKEMKKKTNDLPGGGGIQDIVPPWRARILPTPQTSLRSRDITNKHSWAGLLFVSMLRKSDEADRRSSRRKQTRKVDDPIRYTLFGSNALADARRSAWYQSIKPDLSKFGVL